MSWKLVMNGVVTSCALCISLLIVAEAEVLPATTTPVETTIQQISNLARSQRWKEVKNFTEKLPPDARNNVEVLYWLGIASLKTGDQANAVQAFRQAEKRGADTVALHEGLGLAYYELNQYILFQEQMRKAAVLNPNDPMPSYHLGIYEKTVRANLVAALDNFKKASGLNPEDYKSLYQAGNCLELSGNPAEAATFYKRAIEIIEKNKIRFGWAYQGMARLMLDTDPQAALSYAKSAVNLQPEESPNHLLLAKLYERTGSLEDAIREAQAATAQDPTDSTARYTLYKLYRRAGDPRTSEELKSFEAIKAAYDRD